MNVRSLVGLLLCLVACIAGSSRGWSSMTASCDPTFFSRDVIRTVQEVLKDRKFNPGPIDGIMGVATKYAIKEFLDSKKLPYDLSLGVITILNDAGYHNVELPAECS